MQAYLIIALIFALLVAVFSIQNASGVDIRLFHWHFPGISLVLVIIGSAVTGAVCAFLLGMPKQLVYRRKLKGLLADNQRLQADIEQLRNPHSAPMQATEKGATCQTSS